MFRKTISMLTCLTALAVAGVLSAEDVKIKAITLDVPKSWEQQPASNRLRLAEFKIKPAEGETDAEIVVYSFGGGGGGVAANISRWVKQFEAEGREVNVTEGKSKAGEYVLVDVSGTYNKPVGPPIRQQTEKTPNSRMLAAIINVGEEGNYFLKLTGGKKTIESEVESFRKSFGADKSSEKPFEQ
jgi:gluconolactonase